MRPSKSSADAVVGLDRAEPNTAGFAGPALNSAPVNTTRHVMNERV